MINTRDFIPGIFYEDFMKHSTIQKTLLSFKDVNYKSFQAKLMPGISENTIIGVRTPILRKYAKEISRTSEAEFFLHSLPHRYYEENNLHGILLEYIKDYSLLIEELDTFLPYVDNWATCDLISPKVFKKHLHELGNDAVRWLNSDNVYTIRFGIKIFMSFFLDEAFDDKYPKLISQINSEEYYVNMAIAWYFATALAKQYPSVISYIENGVLSSWTHNKTIQKALESYRIPRETKLYLKTLKR